MAKFERIYSPREKAIRVRLNVLYASRRYRKRWPERVKRSREHNVVKRQRWLKNHPGIEGLYSKRNVQRMADHYLAQLLRQMGRPVTSETIELKRAELMAHRTRKLFRMFYVTSTTQNQ